MRAQSRVRESLRPFARRLMAEAFVRALAAAFCAGAAASLIVVLASHILPWGMDWRYALIAGASLFVPALAAGLILMRPGERDVARRVDALGLCERAETMLDYENDDGIFARMQREDALRALELLPKSRLRLSMPRRSLALCLLLAAALCAMSFVPNGNQDAIAERRLKEETDRRRERELLEKLEEKIDEAGLADELEEKAKAVLDELQKALEKAGTPSEKLAEISKAQDKLKTLEEEAAKKELENAGKALEKSNAAGELGEAMRKGGAKGMEKALEDMQKELEGLTGKERSERLGELAGAMDEAAGGLPDSSSIGHAMSELADALRKAASGDGGNEVGEGFERLEKALGEAAGGKSAALDDVRQLMEDLRRAAAGQGGSESGGEGQGEGQGEGEGEGQGQGDGKGQGQGKGKGKGSGQGEGQGSGAGAGSGEEIDKYESIYDPSLLGGEGDTEYVPGKPGENGEPQRIEMGDAEVRRGMIPYGEVYGSYVEKARRAMDREGVPEGMRDVIERYFSSLS